MSRRGQGILEKGERRLEKEGGGEKRGEGGKRGVGDKKEGEGGGERGEGGKRGVGERGGEPFLIKGWDSEVLDGQNLDFFKTS